MLPVLVSELLTLDVYARPPDLQTEAVVRPYNTLAGQLSPEGPDVLVWVESDTDRVYATELIDDQLVTRLIGYDVISLTALVDYDGDGQDNILCSRGDGVKVDIETEQEFYIPTCGTDTVGDANGDSVDDLVSPFGTWLSSPTGFVAGGSLYADEDVVSCPTIYPLGDIDSDGRGDFARASVDIGAPFSFEPQLSTLDLYLGAGYSEPVWSPHWRYAHPTRSAGRAVTSADIDADGQDELVVLAANDSTGAVQGEMLLLDDLADPLGPTVLSSEALGQFTTNRNGVYLQNMGDLDADGDDEVLVVMENYQPGSFVTLIDAETWEGGLSHTLGDGFTLPLPAGAELESELAVVGDYNSDGLQDVAMALAWSEPAQDEFGLRGTLAVWLSAPLPHTDDPEESTETPAFQSTPAVPTPDETQRGCGCATAAPRGGLLLLPLLAMRRRRALCGRPSQTVNATCTM